MQFWVINPFVAPCCVITTLLGRSVNKRQSIVLWCDFWNKLRWTSVKMPMKPAVVFYDFAIEDNFLNIRIVYVAQIGPHNFFVAGCRKHQCSVPAVTLTVAQHYAINCARFDLLRHDNNRSWYHWTCTITQRFASRWRPPGAYTAFIKCSGRL